MNNNVYKENEKLFCKIVEMIMVKFELNRYPIIVSEFEMKATLIHNEFVTCNTKMSRI